MHVSYLTAKYTNTDVAVNEYETGIKDWQCIDELYLNRKFRDKVICKIDATKFFNQYFSEDTIIKYRPVLMLIAKGCVRNPEQFSAVIKDFLEKDEVFATKINFIFHECPEDVSFGDYIIASLANILIETESRYRTFFRGRKEFVICMSDGWLYVSFDDDYTGPLFPDNVECEVLSYAKNWRGQIRYWR